VAISHNACVLFHAPIPCPRPLVSLGMLSPPHPAGLVPLLHGYDPFLLTEDRSGDPSTNADDADDALAEDRAAGREVHAAWAHEDRMVSAAFAVVHQHARDLNIPAEAFSSPPTPPRHMRGDAARLASQRPTRGAPSVVNRPGATSYPPPPKDVAALTASPPWASRAPPSQLGRQYHGIAYFSGTAPSSVFQVLADGQVVSAESQPHGSPVAPAPFSPCFGPPVIVSDSAGTVALPVGSLALVLVLGRVEWNVGSRGRVWGGGACCVWMLHGGVPRRWRQFWMERPHHCWCLPAVVCVLAAAHTARLGVSL